VLAPHATPAPCPATGPAPSQLQAAAPPQARGSTCAGVESGPPLHRSSSKERERRGRSLHAYAVCGGEVEEREEPPYDADCGGEGGATLPTPAAGEKERRGRSRRCRGGEEEVRASVGERARQERLSSKGEGERLDKE